MATATKPVNRLNGKLNGKVEKPEAPKQETVVIKPLSMRTAEFTLVGTAPFMQAAFSQKARLKIMETQRAGQQSRGKKVREKRDFEQDFEQAKHKFSDGTCGIPAGAFRNAMISACRTVGFAMTLAKLSIFIEADGLDVVDGTPLVRIEGTPEMSIMPVRNASGVCDLRSRPQWKKWSVTLRIKWDESQFSLTDVANLLNRVGQQVGIGEGRPDSKSSAGMGFGTFAIQQ